MHSIRPIDNFYLQQEEPARACLQFLREHRQPYLGIVDGKSMQHQDLQTEKRARMKILLLDAEKDLPLKKINAILKEMLLLYR